MTTHLRGWLHAITGLLLAVIITLGVAPAATASPAVPVDPTTATVCSDPAASDDSLPVTRWQGAMTLHDRIEGGFFHPEGAAKRAQRNGLTGTLIDVGNSTWAVTVGITEMASRFCVLDKVGGLVDHAGAALATSLLASTVVVILVVASVIAYAWRIARSGRGGGALLQKGLVLGLFGVMLAGASASVGAGAGPDPDAPYEAGRGGPGWWVTRIDGVVSATANLTGSQFQQHALEGAEGGVGGRDGLGCAPAVGGLHEAYRDQFGTDAVSQAPASSPLILSAMWEQSGLQMWKAAQFGTKTAGIDDDGKPWTHGDVVYCRMLDDNAGLLKAPAGAESDALAWRHTDDNETQDRRWVGWAACTAPSHGADLISSDASLGNACDRFFNEPGYDGGDFNWDDDDAIAKADLPEGAESFLRALHGTSGGTLGAAAGFVYVVTSMAIMLVVGGFWLAVIVAKFAALITMLGIWFALLKALVPSSGLETVAKVAKQYLGISAVIFCASTLFSLVALVTGLLIEAGSAIIPGGPGGVVGLVWTGFTPIAAALCVWHVIKMLKVAEPLKAAISRVTATGSAGKKRRAPKARQETPTARPTGVVMERNAYVSKPQVERPNRMNQGRSQEDQTDAA